MTFDFTIASTTENNNFYSALFEITDKFSVDTANVTSERMIPHSAICWYMKTQVENPALIKNTSLKSKSNREAKNTLYGSPKVSTKISISILEAYSKSLDFQYLLSRSESFKIFHNQVKIFTLNLKKEFDCVSNCTNLRNHFYSF